MDISPLCTVSCWQQVYDTSSPRVRKFGCNQVSDRTECSTSTAGQAKLSMQPADAAGTACLSQPAGHTTLRCSMSAPSSSRYSTQLMWPAQGSHAATSVSLMLGALSLNCDAFRVFFTSLTSSGGL